MDPIDRKIVRELQADGRLTNQELADRVGLSPSPCLRRVRNLEKAGVITGYAALVDPAAYGLDITAFVRIRLERHTGASVVDFEKGIRGVEEILECHLMTGEYDYLLRVVVASLEAYEDFMRKKIHAIPGIGSIDTSFSFSTIKSTHVYPRVAG